jgi:predicted Zn-dependent protease
LIHKYDNYLLAISYLSYKYDIDSAGRVLRLKSTLKNRTTKKEQKQEREVSHEKVHEAYYPLYGIRHCPDDDRRAGIRARGDF